MQSQGVSLNLRMRYTWCLSFVWAGLNSSVTPAVLNDLFTGDKLQLLSLGPTYLLPHYTFPNTLRLTHKSPRRFLASHALPLAWKSHFLLCFHCWHQISSLSTVQAKTMILCFCSLTCHIELSQGNSFSSWSYSIYKSNSLTLQDPQGQALWIHLWIPPN